MSGQKRDVNGHVVSAFAPKAVITTVNGDTGTTYSAYTHWVSDSDVTYSIDGESANVPAGSVRAFTPKMTFTGIFTLEVM
jgi:hypothetical protein